MEEVSLIVTALATGAAGGALDALKDDVKDKAKAVYVKLHELVRRRRGGTPAPRSSCLSTRRIRRPTRHRLPRSWPKPGRAATPSSWRRRGRSWNS